LPAILITGGAGFLGSHLCDAFIERQYDVIAVDNLASGRRQNVAHLLDDPRFELVEADLRDRPDIDLEVDVILHFASLASPPAYLAQPLMTLETGSFGTHWCIDRALKNNARMVIGFIRNPRPTGATSIRSAPAACTTKPSATPRPQRWPIAGKWI